jgi:RHS repeat-associated protein
LSGAASVHESGLDYFGARYFSWAQGRFTSPDEALLDQHPEDPQSWNLYQYGRNQPLLNIDPSGMENETVPLPDLPWWQEQLLRQLYPWNQLAQAAQAAYPAWDQFRHSPNCAGTLTAAGSAVGAVGVGYYSMQAGAVAGAAVGAPSGTGAVVTAGGGALLFSLDMTPLGNS